MSADYKKMSHVIYGQNKVICFIDLPKELVKNNDPFMQINPLVLVVFHFHYPCVYYENVFQHFKHLLPQKTNPLQIRLRLGDTQLPSDIPIGLFIENQGHLTVSISEFEISEPQKIIKHRWKQAFSGINPVKGNYYIFKQLGEEGLKPKLALYFKGDSHGFQKEEYEGYEGTYIVTRFFIEGEIIERRSEAGDTKTVLNLIHEQMPLLKNRKYTVKSHAVEFDLGMGLRQFLDEWTYNDGFCYLKIDLLD